VNDFQALLGGGLAEMEAICGVTIEWRGRSIPAIQGAGMSYEALVNGGVADYENPTFQVRRAALEAVAGSETFEPDDSLVVNGRALRIRTVSFDPADVAIRLTTEGENQE
jgi:hypothetical protein